MGSMTGQAYRNLVKDYVECAIFEAKRETEEKVMAIVTEPITKVTYTHSCPFIHTPLG